MLILERVRKTFGGRPVLRDISVDFKGGEVVLLTGRNGSGKSTFLRIAAGLQRPDGGLVRLRGAAVADRPADVGYVGHQLLLYQQLTVRENIELAARLLRVSINIENQLERWNILHFRDELVANLSRGVQTRASLCRMTMHNPPLLLLDEPTSALDDPSVDILLEVLKARTADDYLTLMTGHEALRVKQLCNRGLHLAGGRMESGDA